MNEAPSIRSNLNDETLFRLNKINKIEDYFTTEIKEGETMSKRLNKYIAAFDFIHSGGIPITSYISIIGTPVGMASESFNLAFSLTARIIKKLLKTTRNKKEET